MTRIVIKARGPTMNPQWWTPERCEQIRKADAIAHQTDVLANFSDAEEQLYPEELLRRCVMAGVESIGRVRGREYEAGMDPATRTNAWCMAVASRRGNIRQVVRAVEWRGSPDDPLRSRVVLREAAEILAEYGLDFVRTDQWATDPLREIASDLKGSDPDYQGPKDLTLLEETMTRQERVTGYIGIKDWMSDGTLEIVDVAMLIKDLKFARRKAIAAGVDVVLVKTPDGRHADFAPATLRALLPWLDEDTDTAPPVGTPERDNWQDEQDELAEAEEDLKPWWDRRDRG